MSKILAVFFSRRMLSVFLLGISSGLPLLLIGSTLKAWMKEEGIDLTVIGIFGLAGLPYTLKFLWSPLIDRYHIPFLDRRRGWIFFTQICLSIAIAALALLSPKDAPWWIAFSAFIIAFLSASQDIAIDAYRRDVLSDNELGLGSSLGVNGYRVGMLLAGAFALPLADQFGWADTYFVMAGIMALCTVGTLIAPPIDESIAPAPNSLRDAVIDPFLDYFRRPDALLILAFILLYKIGDQMASDMLTPFYLDIGFTKTEVGVVSKFFGFWSTIIGGLLGGIAIIKLGMTRALWVFGILQALSTAGFAVLAHLGALTSGLAAVVVVENITGGMGTAAYTGFMASLCNKRFTATQYALLSSFIGVPRVFLGATSGYLAKNLGWSNYFIFCTLIAIPGLFILVRYILPKEKV